ncbi:hypothetical protein TSACC_22786 [Terrimicrobium sacchariphilum]|uniref:YdhG-like domain-containing protein n=1 Tax=Terrimicrobium sacchariphilum TaxID=690879 RepID=A0A146GAA9_TERSA|nr:YdeI/OmpD-associated family protein [Terrimicrobium sacchariphilum]GAT34361.1 hypothetical protein TSACC_22786 [Terrimicrobium sacchariphilum]
MNRKVDLYIAQAKSWREETEALREIALGWGLTEELKWGKPCYSFAGSNVAIIQGFKGYCALLFCKGALLKDVAGILVRPGENTQAARQARFMSAREIAEKADLLKAYLCEAIAVEKAGTQVRYKETADFAVPEELTAMMKKEPALKEAFAALTPGRQRGYLLYFAGAKQSATRTARIEKCRDQILAGKGLRD